MQPGIQEWSVGTVHLPKEKRWGGVSGVCRSKGFCRTGFKVVLGLWGVVGLSYLGGSCERLWGKADGKKQAVAEQSSRRGCVGQGPCLRNFHL